MAAAMDAPLTHVRQRLDALVYDDHSQYLVGSLQHPDALVLVMSQPSIPHLPLRATTPPLRSHNRNRMSTVGVSIRRRRLPGRGRWTRVVGVTPYYALYALFLGLGWLAQALGVFAFALAFPSIISASSVGYVKVVSVHQSVVVLSFFSIAEMVGAVGFGACADHYGRRRVLLAALLLAWLGQALVVFATSYAALVASRLVTGLGLGGQSALLVAVALECAPKRTRGRVLVLSQLLGAAGFVLAALVGKLVTPWRYAFATVAVLSLAVAGVFTRYLRESPTYLASIGRVDQALTVIHAIESAHGIDRHARVTVPSSLYAPPSQTTQIQRQDPHQSDNNDSNDSDSVAPLPRRGTGDAYGAPPSGNVGRPRASTDRHAAASPAMVSFSVSSTRRFRVLFEPLYVRETLFLWSLWFVVSAALGAAVTAVVRHLDRIDRVGVGAYVLVGILAVPGLVLSAVLVEQQGRKHALTLLLTGVTVLLFAVGACLSGGATAASVVLTTSGLAFFVAGAFAALCVYTGEHYALMVRAMGIAWALASGHLGSFVGVYVALTSWVPVKGDVGHRVLLYVAGGLCAAAAVAVFALGRETKDRDIDVLEPVKDESNSDNDGVGRKHHPDDLDRLDDNLDSDDTKFVVHVTPTTTTGRTYVHTNELSTVPSSPGVSFSSASSSSSASSAKFFAGHPAKKTWKKQVRALAAAAASSVVPKRKSAALRKHSTRSTLQADSCTDLDQLDTIVTDGETNTARHYVRHNSNVAVLPPSRRKLTAASDASEPALLDWRPSDADSDDGADPSYPHDDAESGDGRSDSESDTFSIEMDSFRSLSTPMLEGSPQQQQLTFER